MDASIDDDAPDTVAEVPRVALIREPSATSVEFTGGRFSERYERGGLLGVGGMGEVRTWRDRATGRDVAVKSIRADRPDAEARRRFAREARIQAQLEHPSVVPVYDLGIADGGDFYFTMKRVRGHSLSRVLATVADRGEASAGYSQRKLLTVLARVAMTLEYAHRRGVVNRDLKPANIMLGAFDEVYVIDWGLAALHDPAVPGTASRPDLPLSLPISAAALHVPLLDSSQRPETGTGQLLGTPGYVAPEQVHSPDLVDGRCDVYALGVILFEILTGTRLHAGASLAEVLMSTLQLDGASPAARAPEREIAPELDELCRRATRLDPSDRLPHAIDFARAIEAYLDGDRDLARRRELAAEAAAAATQLLADPRPASDEAARRAQVVRDVGRALALDPENVQARATLVRALTEAPVAVPAAADDMFRATAVHAFRLSSRNATFAMLTYALYLPFLFWMGVREPWMLAVMATAILAVTGITYHYYRRPPPSLRVPTLHVVATTAALVTGVFLFGPLVLLPAIVISTGVGYIATFGRRTVYYIVPGIAVVLVPLALQLAGVIAPSYALTDGEIRVLPMMLSFPPAATMAFLAVTHTVIIAGTLLYVWRLRCNYLDSERRLRGHAWLLAQMLPDETHAPLARAG